MSYPQDFLDARGEIYLGSWTDATKYMLLRDPISIRRGRPDESSQINPALVNLTVNNHDGRWTVRNPLGAWYGQLVQNTPLRLSVPASVAGGTNYLRMEENGTGYVTGPGTGGVSISGDIDIRIDLDITSWAQGTWAVKAGCWLLGLQSSGTPLFQWADTVTSHRAPCNAVIPAGRTTLRVTLAVSTGIVTFYTGTSISGASWTQLGSAVSSGAATGGLETSTSPIIIGFDAADQPAGPCGAIYGFAVLSGIGGTVKSAADFTASTAGASTYTDPQSNIWTVTSPAEFSDRLYRAHAELSNMPKAADPSQRDIYSQVNAYGITHRLQQGNTPVFSAVRRAVTSASPATGAVLAYWPCEDAPGAPSIASGWPGGTPMSFLGTPGFGNSGGTPASDSDFPGSAELPTLNGSIWSASVPAASGTPAWNTVPFLCLIPSGGDMNNSVLVRMQTTGTIAQYDIVYTTAASGTLTANIYSGTGSLLASNVQATGVNGQPMAWTMALAQNGTATEYWLEGTSLGISQPGGGFFSQSSATVGQLSRIQVNPGGGLQGTKIGQFSAGTFSYLDSSNIYLADFTDYSSIIGFGGAAAAWYGEPAGSRFLRLCAENGVPARLAGPVDLTVPMGAQTLDTLENLLQQIENTDLGMLYEPRQVLGLGYITNHALVNQAVAVTADYSKRQVQQGFSSAADDLLTVNDVTVNNADGSAATVSLAAGPMSTQNPPNGIGKVDTSTSTYAAGTADMPGYLGGGVSWLANIRSATDLASWTLHVRSVNEDRYPDIPFQMARPETPLSVALLDIGGYAQVTNPAAWLPAGPVKQLAAGLNEQLGPGRNWPISVNGIPESPYEVAIGGTGASDSAHGDTAGSQLATSASASATTLQAITVTGPAWTTKAPSLPFYIQAAGEEIEVTAVAAAAAASIGIDDGTFETGVSQWTPTGGTLAQSSAHAHTGTYSALLTVSGSPTQAFFRNNDKVPVIPGVVYTASLWLYGSSVTNCMAAIDWYDARGNYLSTSSGTSGTATTTFTQFTVTGAAPAGAAFGVYGPTIASSPSNGTQLWTDDVLFTVSAQALTVTRAVNGIAKAQSALAALSLFNTPIAALN